MNSHKFLGYYSEIIHSISYSLVTESSNQIHCDHDYTLVRSSDKLLPIDLIA